MFKGKDGTFLCAKGGGSFHGPFDRLSSFAGATERGSSWTREETALGGRGLGALGFRGVLPKCD